MENNGPDLNKSVVHNQVLEVFSWYNVEHGTVINYAIAPLSTLKFTNMYKINNNNY